MKKLILIAVATLALGAAFGGCGKRSDFGWRHSDWGYCEKTGRHKHNDHVFIGDFHDHSLCEWEKYQ